MSSGVNFFLAPPRRPRNRKGTGRVSVLLVEIEKGERFERVFESCSIYIIFSFTLCDRKVKKSFQSFRFHGFIAFFGGCIGGYWQKSFQNPFA